MDKERLPKAYRNTATQFKRYMETLGSEYCRRQNAKRAVRIGVTAGAVTPGTRAGTEQRYNGGDSEDVIHAQTIP